MTTLNTFVNFIQEGHDAAKKDRLFFKSNPHRRFLARTPYDDEFGIILFASDESGVEGEINIVIAKQVVGGRLKQPFFCSTPSKLQSDADIASFLRSRGIDPATMRRVKK
jgi:hypothetical protein